MVEQEKPEGAGEADKQASNPNGARCDVVIEKSADHGREGAGKPPSEPVDGHITAAQICRRTIRHIFAGSWNKSKLTKGQDDHAELKSPKAAHQGNTACAECIDQHRSTENGKSRVLPCNARHQVLHKDTHQRIGGGNPTV